MIELFVVVVGLVAGFGGARLVRRPANTAGAASVARSVGSAVGTRRDLDLGHLQRSTLSEMMRHVSTRGGAAQVPNAYRIRLSPSDYETVQQAPGFFAQGLETAITAAARDRDWQISGRPRIQIEADSSRPPGAPAVDVASPIPDLTTPSPAPLGARLERDDGVVIELQPGLVMGIGRGADQSIRVDDPRVSRQHATIQLDLQLPRPNLATLTDQGSSNGTRLNGAALTAHQPTTVPDGSVIEIGPTRFTLRAPSASPDSTAVAGPYQQVLDEQQLRSISQEYFGGSNQ